MTTSLLLSTASTENSYDLAGAWCSTPTLPQLCRRIATLTQRYVTLDHLQNRFEELPQQFQNPCPRPWVKIDWAAIDPDQIRGISVATFCRILVGTINTEAPIHGYTQASRQYLERFYPAMAQFVGGQVDAAGRSRALGLWEIEEKRHTPALVALYQRLSGQKPQIIPHSARPYSPSGDPRQDLYRHGLHRIATEYGATSLYLWMMVYTTGPLQAVLGELLIDEINHMTKFWGFGRWAYPHTGLHTITLTLGQAMVQKLRNPQLQGSLWHTLRRMMAELSWADWSPTQRLTLIYSFDQVMRVLWRWDATLSRAYLDSVLGPAGETVNAANPGGSLAKDVATQGVPRDLA